MLEHGNLFFILDSFDEIPQLLDEGEDSWLIEHLSELIWTFIAGNRASRGLLASRFFRRPTDSFQASKILEIRPLSEEKIVQALGRFPRFDNALQKQLFYQRNDLVPIVRNPFLMALLGAWVQEHGSFPRHQGEIYDSYLRGRLLICKKRLDQKGVSVDELLETATAIAWFLFNSKEYGLEAPVNVIEKQPEISKAALAMELLVYARIGRIGSGDNHTFAFVHRRFLEYFSVQRLITCPQEAPIEDIPTDSRGRDALVLYAQVAEQKEAERLARYCWDQLLVGFDQEANWLRAVHSLRFLSDAFRARRECILPFQDELAEFIMNCVRGDEKDLILAKLSLEATGLLSENRVESVLQEAIEGGNDWLQETAFKGCKNIPRISTKMQDSLLLYIWNIPTNLFWANRRSFLFSLSLSPGLFNILAAVKSRIFDIGVLFLGIFLCFIALPYIGCGILILYFICSVINAAKGKWFDITYGDRLGMAVGLIIMPISYILKEYLHQPNILHDYVFIQNITNFLNTNSMTNSKYDIDDTIISSFVLNPKSNISLFFSFFAIALTQTPILRFINFFPRWISKLTVKYVVNIFKLIGSVILMVVFSVGIFYLAISYKWIKTIGFVFTGFIGIVILIIIAIEGYYRVLDLKLKNRLNIPDRLTRVEITKHLNDFKTDFFKLRFVELLAEKKVVAVGEWPEGFSLNARNDKAITQLARLEEKWLGLDR